MFLVMSKHEESPRSPRGGRWVSMREAAVYLGVWEGTVRKRITEGLIEARKIGGPNGPEWRILIPDPEGGSDLPTGSLEVGSRFVEARLEPDPEADPEATVREPVGEREVALAIADALHRVEQSAYRVGYLEAQLAQLPALTEGQAAAEAREREATARAARAEASAAEERARSGELARRGRVTAIAAVLLALVAAVMGGMLLTARQSGQRPRPTRLPLRSSDTRVESHGAPASAPGGPKPGSESRSSGRVAVGRDTLRPAPTLASPPR